MDTYIIKGLNRLSGSIRIQGAKNSVLPILSASILNAGESVIHNCPALRDVDAALNILRYLGCIALREGDTVFINSSTLDKCSVPPSLMHEMRSSVIFLGAILSRTGEAHVAHPGGCELGARPIDLHLSALRSMGADITEEKDSIVCKAKKLEGCRIHLPFPSVGATENVMIAATMARGKTVLTNAAREPEIADLQRFLNAMGAAVRGAGSSTIVIEGVSTLSNCSHRVMPDRIAAATYMACCASAGGKAELLDARGKDLHAVCDVFRKAGCTVKENARGILFERTGELRAPGQSIFTAPHPGFPTDAQAPVMAALLKAEGISSFTENIFENRYRHVPQLLKFGADITVNGKEAHVRGAESLFAACTEATDLRGGASLVTAALGARGESRVTGLHHIDRGYESFDENLRLLGADIIRTYDKNGSAKNG